MSFGFLRVFAQLLAFASFAAPCFAQISINEILADNKIYLTEQRITDWVELYNSASQPVSLAGYSLTDSTNTPKKWVVPNNVTIPATGFLVILLDSSAPASLRLESPLNAGFSLKSSGDTIALYSPTAQLVEMVQFGPQAANFSIGRVPAAVRSFVLCTPTPGSANIQQPLGDQKSLFINEWLASESSGKDFIELYNPGSLPVQLTGMYFTDDGNVPSPISPFSFIGTNAFIKFTSSNNTNGSDVNFGLSSKGDSISLYSSTRTLVDHVAFGPQVTDISEGRLPDGSTNIKSLITPTPGESNFVPYPGLVVNELLSHTDEPLEDAVEFYNQTAAPIDISGWYLSNQRSNLRKMLVPKGTTVPANGYKVFYQYQFDATNDPNGFTFNSAHGDQVYLAQANAAGDLTGYMVSEVFEAAEHGISFGRYESQSVPGDYKFVAMDHLTFGGPDNAATVEQFRTGLGAPNSAPKVGPVVISEVMYHPPDAADGSDDVVDEFVELRNITVQTVPLYDPAHPENRWRLQGGVALTFPPGATLPPLGFALVLSFNPTNSTNAAQLAAFRAKYNVPSEAQIFGGYSGKLNNGGDAVELYKPDPPQDDSHPDRGFVPYIRVDKVNYLKSLPWPTQADGTGQSLQRKSASQFGNDAVNWQAGAPTAGKPNLGEVVDSDGDGIPDLWERQFGLDPNNPADAALDPDADGYTNLQEYLSGTDPKNAASHLGLTLLASSFAGSTLTFPSVPGKTYSVQVRNDLSPARGWQNLVSTNASGNTVTVQDTNTGGDTQRYYRLVTPAVQ